MLLDEAIETLKKAVKYTGTIDQKHIDLGVIPVEERDRYQKALIISHLSIKEGKITKEDFLRRLNLNH